ncbi:MAG: TauD/TfdA family dioxygenase [Gammaproteobacteria bacterium]|nr:TauD/TfdA family dioxygenase [Gammaproteobacteria bacterium]
MKIESITENFGAVVTDIALNALSEPDFRTIEQAWFRYAVLVFPHQHLSNEDHFAFTRRFGRLEKGLPGINTKMRPNIGNTDNEGKVLPREHIGRVFNIGNSLWHSDSSYKRVGAKASLLAAHEVPTEGGETEWADMRAGYDALSDDMKRFLSDKIAVHSYAFSHSWHYGLRVMPEEGLRQLPPVEHPIIKVHPDSKRHVLFVGRHASHIIGEDFESSRKLLRELTFEAAQPPRTFGHRWDVGDIVIWDNRCVLHRARASPPDQARKMVRSTVAGDAPDNEWAVVEAA